MNFESYDGYDEAYDGDYGGESDYDEMSEDSGYEEYDDVTERRRRPAPRRPVVRPFPKTVPVATGAPAVRAAAPTGPGPYVQQRQFADSLGQVGADLRRNAMGIKTVNNRLGILDGRVATVMGNQRSQSVRIAKIGKQIQLDGALDIAQTFVVDPTTSTLNINASPAQILQGAVKLGALGSQTGLLANPFVVGGIGFLLNSGILGNLFAARQVTP